MLNFHSGWHENILRKVRQINQATDIYW